MKERWCLLLTEWSWVSFQEPLPLRILPLWTGLRERMLFVCVTLGWVNTGTEFKECWVVALSWMGKLSRVAKEGLGWSSMSWAEIHTELAWPALGSEEGSLEKVALFCLSVHVCLTCSPRDSQQPTCAGRGPSRAIALTGNILRFGNCSS